MNLGASAKRLLRLARRALAGGFTLAILAGACAPAGTAPAGPAASAAPAPAASAAPAPAVTAAPAPSGPPAVVSIGVVSNVLNAPFYVGVDKGIYLKNGIDLKVTTVAAGTDAIKGMQGGTYQLSSTSWATILPAVAQGVPFKLITPTVGGPVANFDKHITLMIRPGVAVDKVADLKGKTIAVALGTAPETWLRTTLKSAGLDPDKDVKLVNVAVPNELSVLQSGGADAGMPIEPYSSLILKTLAGSKVLIRGGGLVDGRVNVIAMAPWLDQNPKIADRIVAAHLEASQYIRQNPDESAAITARYLTGLDLSVVASGMKFIDFDPRWSDQILQGFENTTKELVANGTIKTALKASDILVLDRLTNMQKTYPQFFSDLK